MAKSDAWAGAWGTAWDQAWFREENPVADDEKKVPFAKGLVQKGAIENAQSGMGEQE